MNTSPSAGAPITFIFSSELPEVIVIFLPHTSFAAYLKVALEFADAILHHWSHYQVPPLAFAHLSHNHDPLAFAHLSLTHDVGIAVVDFRQKHWVAFIVLALAHQSQEHCQSL